ncbi:hypothetical protein ONS96_013629 [Cadophora gregata f. sp. sojae]|nr:hypothetical protein ONS96_013629 [Cadophora gregata f. sp. sojae]
MPAMGCCASTVQANPYPAQNPNNGNSSFRAINSSQPASQAMIPTRPSTNASTHSGTHHRPNRDLTKHPTKDLKLHVWKSQTRTWTRDQLDAERIEFFDTRTSGREETWQAIRTALEILWAGGDAEDNDGGLATAQAILRAAGVTIPSGDLTAAVYDANGARYELPEHIVCDPTNIVEMPTRTEDDEGDKSEEDGETADEAELLRRDEIRRGKAVVNLDDMVDIKVKLSDRDNRPLIVSVSKQDTVRIVTKKIYEESGLEAPKHIRIAYLGKILKDNKTLKDQGWEEQNVLNGLVLG